MMNMKKLISVLCLVLACSLALPALSEGVPSDDWMEFEVSIGGTLSKLPAPVAPFLADGWELEDPDETLEPNQYSLSRRLTKDGAEYYVQIVNLGIDELPVSECLIGQISLDDYQAKKGGTLILPAGITLGSTPEDVEAAYGMPGRTYEGSSSISYTYEGESYTKIEIRFDGETKQATGLTIRSFITPEGYNDEAYARPDEVPQVVLDYAPPAALGDDVLSFNFRIGDALYTLPASYQYMESQGWKLAEKLTEKVPAYSYRRLISLVLGGYSVSTQLYNDSPMATMPQNCFITSLRIDSNAKLDVEIAGGISLGMSGEDLLKAIEAQPHEVIIDEYSSFTMYTFKQDILQEVKINLSTETNTVQAIELQFQP